MLLLAEDNAIDMKAGGLGFSRDLGVLSYAAGGQTVLRNQTIH
jgi:hypothetical protein